MRRGMFALPTVVAIATTALLAGPAAADTMIPGVGGDVQLVVLVDGVAVPVDAAIEEASLIDLDPVAPSNPDIMTPYLIDFPQWISCFGLHNEEDVFAEYVF